MTAHMQYEELEEAVRTQHMNTATMAFLQENNNIRIVEPSDAVADTGARVVEPQAAAASEA